MSSREGARQIIANIKALHADAGPSQGYDENGHYGYLEHCCGTCGEFGEYGVRWPCPTYIAVNGGSPTETIRASERVWCEPCRLDTIPVSGVCAECNQPVGRSTAPDRIQEH